MTEDINDLQGAGDPAHLRVLLAVALVSIVAGGTLDLLMDRPSDWLSFHVVFETSMVAGALLMATNLWLGWYRAEKSVTELRLTLANRGQERDAWRQSAQLALGGLSEAIGQQFQGWKLTHAEREVALLLLKGYSHKQVAQATGRSERTARQHAVAVYAKAGVAGRSELAAYFLEDLMLPEAQRERGCALLHADAAL